MTTEEAIIVLEAAAKAGCIHCFETVFQQLVAKLPGTDWKPALFEAELDMEEEQKVRCWNENQVK